ncbi:MAG: hypothetical protein ABIR98_06940 [Usitatibacter sp.]
MNHQLWASVGARVVALTFVVAGIGACGERLSDTSSRTPRPTAASPSAVVIGQAPAEPQPGVASNNTPSGTTELSKSVESNSMPLPGQPNDHSNVAPKPSQSAESTEVLKSTEAAKQANNGEKQERAQ